jgi:high-affinity nickel-transport protein
VGNVSALRSLAVGLAHGLAGSAAVALLALAAMPTPQAALLYLAVFGLGTIGAMVALSTGLGLPAALASGRPALARWVVAGSGALSIGVGIYLAVSVGVAGDLL